MDDLLQEFLMETSESLDVVDVELVKFEQDPNNRDVLDNIFRLVHTVKGTCGFLGLPRLESVAHASETLLGKFRDGEVPVTPEAVTLILESLDRIKEILATLEQTEEEPSGDDSPLIKLLEVAASGGSRCPKKPTSNRKSKKLMRLSSFKKQRDWLRRKAPVKKKRALQAIWMNWRRSFRQHLALMTWLKTKIQMKKLQPLMKLKSKMKLLNKQ